jgi:hypothetical protein
MPSTVIEERGPATGAELFAPPRWLAIALLVAAGAAPIAALASAWLPMPLVAHGLVPLPLVAASALALHAWRRCRVQYLVGERELTQTVRGQTTRTIAFPDVLEFREIPTLWGGRRVRLTHPAGPLDIELTFLGAQARRLFATLRYRMRPQFFRRVDQILTHGGRFAVRPGARARLALGIALAAVPELCMLGMTLGLIAAPVALLLILLQLEAACLVVTLDDDGLAARSLWRRQRVRPGHVAGVRFQTRTRLIGAAERVIVLDCETFQMQIPDSITEFEALAGAIEGFARRTVVKGLAQL